MVVLRNSYTTRPVEPTPRFGICISDCDQDKPITHVPLIYFYRSLTCLSFASTEVLKISLSKALVYFYPLVGRLYWTTNDHVTLECNSKGSRLYEVESNAKINDFKDFCPTLKLRSLIPSVDYNNPLHELPLLLVQLTKFNCSAINLGLAISHIMIDGASFSHFISMWAKIARGELLDFFSFLDRTLLLAWDPPIPPRFNHERFNHPPLLIGRSDYNEERSKETTVALLHLSKTQVEKLKHMASVISRATNLRPYSRYEAVAGHLWRCMCKAREHQNNQITKLYLPIGCRNWMQPPLPQGYFGNTHLRIATSSQSGKLMTRPLGHPSSKITEAVEMVTNDYIRSAHDLVKSQSN